MRWLMIMFYINYYDKELKFIQFTYFTHFTTLSLIRFDHNIVKCVGTQHTRDVDPMPIQCWHTVCDADPTPKQHWANVPVSAGYLRFYVMLCCMPIPDPSLLLYRTETACFRPAVSFSMSFSKHLLIIWIIRVAHERNSQGDKVGLCGSTLTTYWLVE